MPRGKILPSKSAKKQMKSGIGCYAGRTFLHHLHKYRYTYIAFCTLGMLYILVMFLWYVNITYTIQSQILHLSDEKGKSCMSMSIQVKGHFDVKVHKLACQ